MARFVGLLMVFFLAFNGESQPMSHATVSRCAWYLGDATAAAPSAAPDTTSPRTGWRQRWLQHLWEGGRGGATSSSNRSTGLPVMPRECRRRSKGGETGAPSITWHPHTCVSAEFGVPMPTLSSTYRLLSASPLDACSPFNETATIPPRDDDSGPRDAKLEAKRSLPAQPAAHVDYRGRAVLALRGNCSFETKALHAGRAGAAALLVLDDRLGAEPMPMGSSGGVAAEEISSSGLAAVMVGGGTESAFPQLLAQLVRSDTSTAMANTTDANDLLNAPTTGSPICYTLAFDELAAESADSGVGHSNLAAAFGMSAATLLVLLLSLVLGVWWALGGTAPIDRVGGKEHDTTLVAALKKKEEGNVERCVASMILLVVVAGTASLRLTSTLRVLDIQPGVSAVGVGSAAGVGSAVRPQAVLPPSLRRSGKAETSSGPPSVFAYNHRETDEVILRALALNVWDEGFQSPFLERSYSLLRSESGGKDDTLIRRLGLARENYAKPVFHHPPGFILVSLFLEHPVEALHRFARCVAARSFGMFTRFDTSESNFHHGANDGGGGGGGEGRRIETSVEDGHTIERLGMPYPAVPVLLAALTTLLTVRLAGPRGFGFLDLEGQLWAGLIQCLCPVSWWTSQKYWLDNALAAAVAATMLSAAPILRESIADAVQLRGVMRRAAIVALYLSAALWCKITAVLIGPALCLVALSDWPPATIPTESTERHPERRKAEEENRRPQTQRRSRRLARRSPMSRRDAAGLCSSTTENAYAEKSAAATDSAKLEKNSSSDSFASRIATKKHEKHTSSLIRFVAVVAVRFLVAVAVLAATYLRPWVLWYHTRTGLWLPPALPSADMLSRAPFVAVALGRPTLFYVSSLCGLAPVYAAPFLRAAADACASCLLRGTRSPRATRRPSRSTLWQRTRLGESNASIRSAADAGVRVLWAWAVGFIFGMSALGTIGGAGFQMRFVLPAMPALSILSAEALSRGCSVFDDGGESNDDDEQVRNTRAAVNERRYARFTAICGAVALAVGAAHCLYYGVLFAPLYAEIGGSTPSGASAHTIWAAAAAAQGSPLPYPPPEDLQRGFPWLTHYGVVV